MVIWHIGELELERILYHRTVNVPLVDTVLWCSLKPLILSFLKGMNVVFFLPEN